MSLRLDARELLRAVKCQYCVALGRLMLLVLTSVFFLLALLLVLIRLPLLLVIEGQRKLLLCSFDDESPSSI